MNMFSIGLKKLELESIPLYWRILFFVGLFFSLFLAIYPFYAQYTFAFDQARDAYEAYSIWHAHHLKILGPGTDIPGVFHGVLWYYLLALLYGVTLGNPIFAGALFFILLFITVLLVGKVAQEMFNDTYVSLSAMLLYAMSPLFQAFSRWFSNPDLSLLVMPFLLISFWRYLRKKGRFSSLILGISLGLLVQSDFGFAMFYLLLPVYLLLYKRKPSLPDIGWFILGGLLSLGTFILAEIKFNFRTITSVLHFFSAHHSSSSSMLTTLGAIGQKYIDGLHLSVLPFPTWMIGILLIVGICVIVWKRKSISHKGAVVFLLVWLTNIILFRVFNTGLTTSNFIFAPSLLVFAILLSYVLSRIFPNKKLFALSLLILLVSQAWSNYGWIQKGVTALSVQQGIVYSEEKKVIEYTYASAEKKPFTISTVTNPLFITTLWSYLYEFVGKPEYGYLPYFDGKSQEGYLGSLPAKKDETRFHYLIFEPPAGIPDIYLTKAEYTLDLYTDLVEEKHFGNFVVQKRVYHPHKPTIPVPVDLKESPILYE